MAQLAFLLSFLFLGADRSRRGYHVPLRAEEQGDVRQEYLEDWGLVGLVLEVSNLNGEVYFTTHNTRHIVSPTQGLGF